MSESYFCVLGVSPTKAEGDICDLVDQAMDLTFVKFHILSYTKHYNWVSLSVGAPLTWGHRLDRRVLGGPCP
jgi:hypothetical protein